ncbi:Ribosomal large subunit pseudouridine synthase D [Enhygromyxa salina]|uniref:Pseudouridine synthase n=1 Tax=Enhygromyxa salina TaxID=215803 RepID=A0A0C2CVQ0_9BACT|nr:RluA family pseudouridine synthase [Enhygromyxa salina]KIG15151.1 Ribosomal large subunit pseudouridine synthase D [Enhygromyxa salina]
MSQAGQGEAESGVDATAFADSAALEHGDAEVYDDIVYDENGRPYIEFELEVGPGSEGQRLDRFLSQRFTRMSRNRVHKMLAGGGVRCRSSGESMRKNSLRIRAGQVLVIRRPAPIEPPVVLDYAILHRDPHLLVLDKPANLPVHPSARYHRHTLTALMRRRLGPGHGWEMAHRLDRETSGVMVFGRRKGSGPLLKGSFFRREVDKQYLALVGGRFEGAQTIDVPLGSAKDSRILIKIGPRAIDDGGQLARTDVEALRHGEHRGQPITLVRCWPRTGRTHQIRVHLASIGHPLIGDKLYTASEQEFLDVIEGGRPVAELEARLGLWRHALHASSLSLPHPHTGERVCFTAPWPAELAQLLAWP